MGQLTRWGTTTVKPMNLPNSNMPDLNVTQHSLINKLLGISPKTKRFTYTNDEWVCIKTKLVVSKPEQDYLNQFVRK